MPAWPKGLVAATVGILVAGASLAGIWGIYLRAPLVRLPAPSGTWPVGTATLNVSDGIAGPNSLAAQLWYPAPADARGRRAPYVLRATAPARARLVGAFVGTGALVDVPVAAGRFPVIAYVPGWGGTRENNSSLAQDLASNGYVVVAIDDASPEMPMDFSSERAKRRTTAWAARKLRLERRDVARLLDALARLDGTRGGRFAGRLDLERVGVLGFSFGGAVAADAARSDPRVRAAVNLDGWLFGDALSYGVVRPFLVVSTPLVTATAPVTRFPNEGARILDSFNRDNEMGQLEGLRRHGGFVVTIEDTDHYNFTDAALLPSLRHTGMGALDGRRGAAIVAAYVRQFFDRYLKNRSAPLFDTREVPDSAARLLRFGRNVPVKIAP